MDEVTRVRLRLYLWAAGWVLLFVTVGGGWHWTLGAAVAALLGYVALRASSSHTARRYGGAVPSEPTRPVARVLLDAGVLVALPFIAFFLGTGDYEQRNCSGPDFGGECDLAPLEGFAWGIGAIVLAVILVILIEHYARTVALLRKAS